MRPFYIEVSIFEGQTFDPGRSAPHSVQNRKYAPE
nr:MAG TPA: hypothetical protein [Caudoviricetes sp.]DAL54214.1 MAG TPA_asm: hypothetical protein [Caudoviricetes sp.]DAY99457.1 MAG TPA: hypothetical protein [Caudoviricetes sp.]